MEKVYTHARRPDLLDCESLRSPSNHQAILESDSF